jgi:hypothetical protein
VSGATATERYLAALERDLAVPARYRRRVLGEAADHLAEAAGVLAAAGRPAGEAEAEALRRFGPAGRFAADVNAGWASASARRAPAFGFVAGVAVFAAALVGIPPVPAHGAGSALVAVFSTVAFLALQLGVVAGGVALLRVLARRSAPVLSPADRALVWQAARLCVGSTAVSAAAFLAVAAEHVLRSGSSPGRAAGAALGMLTALTLASSALRRHLPNDAAAESIDEAAGPPVPVAAIERLAAVGERCIRAIRSRPGPTICLVALVSAWGSYAHAETTRPGSLATAAVEAAAVVLFAHLFGPVLELRPVRR